MTPQDLAMNAKLDGLLGAEYIHNTALGGECFRKEPEFAGKKGPDFLQKLDPEEAVTIGLDAASMPPDYFHDWSVMGPLIAAYGIELTPYWGDETVHSWIASIANDEGEPWMMVDASPVRAAALALTNHLEELRGIEAA